MINIFKIKKKNKFVKIFILLIYILFVNIRYIWIK